MLQRMNAGAAAAGRTSRVLGDGMRRLLFRFVMQQQQTARPPAQPAAAPAQPPQAAQPAKGPQPAPAAKTAQVAEAGKAPATQAAPPKGDAKGDLKWEIPRADQPTVTPLTKNLHGDPFRTLDPRVVRAVAVDSRRDARARAACGEGWLGPAASGGNGGRRRGRRPRARRPQARGGEAACRRCLCRARVVDKAPEATRRPRERRRGGTSAPKPASGAPGGRQGGVRARGSGRRRRGAISWASRPAPGATDLPRAAAERRRSRGSASRTWERAR